MLANKFYYASILIGGGTGALDAIDGTALADFDAAIVSINGITYIYHLDATSGAAESSPDIITPNTNAGTKRWIKQDIYVGEEEGTIDYIRLHDEKDSATHGGTFTSGAWRTRDITEDQDSGEHCSVAANVITLAAGTYRAKIRCSAFKVNHHKIRLYSNTDTATILEGASERCRDSDWFSNNSFINNRFTIAAEKELEIQHRCATTYSGRGFGQGNAYGNVNIYTTAEFWKLA